MKKIIFLLLIPFFVWAQGPYMSKYSYPLKYPDTLFKADTLSGGWVFIGDNIGSETFGVILDTDSGIDSLVAITVQCMVGVNPFKDAAGQVMDDSVVASGKGWMTIGTIDSTCIADSVAWLYPLSTEPWWNFYDIVKFRLISPATNDTCILKKDVLAGQ